MTTNPDHEIKFKRLNNLKDPAANRTWITNIINICRSPLAQGRVLTR